MPNWPVKVGSAAYFGNIGINETLSLRFRIPIRAEITAKEQDTQPETPTAGRAEVPETARAGTMPEATVAGFKLRPRALKVRPPSVNVTLVTSSFAPRSKVTCSPGTTRSERVFAVGGHQDVANACNRTASQHAVDLVSRLDDNALVPGPECAEGITLPHLRPAASSCQARVTFPARSRPTRNPAHTCACAKALAKSAIVPVPAALSTNPGNTASGALLQPPAGAEYSNANDVRNPMANTAAPLGRAQAHHKFDALLHSAPGSADFYHVWQLTRRSRPSSHAVVTRSCKRPSQSGRIAP